ncbi:glycosyltransferase [Paenibacillus sp. JX-17]|uniref:4,4'-diaponeurosporenoate glycosyltransferase n=2 Tax=Paenibacillus lacisoli TaxID=3064525 RepID=A0ABT9CDQ8_9BACL|nr:glycosyltransferase [Paenibacillus sp. JX-17]MDO7907000.1 glycosyltransferase [Paenibacillus sp. JX-17]
MHASLPREQPPVQAGPVVSVIIPAMNERRTIGRAVREARRIHPFVEVIVVDNGSSDGTARTAQAAGARVLTYPEPLGHDVGRRVGAEAASGRILLFLDGDMAVPSYELIPFIRAVMAGTDVALNEYSGPVKAKEVHPVVEAKHVLNTMLERPDLQGTSMTAVPHAISRRALEILGFEVLEKPPLAHAKAVVSGLAVRAVHAVEVNRLNRLRRKSGEEDPLAAVVINDHLEAIQWLTRELGPRAGHTDLHRDRHLSEVSL